MSTKLDRLKNRTAPIEMAPNDYCALGHPLVDSLANWLAKTTRGLVTRGESVAEINRALKSECGLPNSGESAAEKNQTIQFHGLKNSGQQAG
jgi:hypothetical protein